MVERTSISGPPVRLAKKVAPGIRASESLDVVANICGLIPQENIPVYRYDFRVLEEYPPKKGSNEPSFKEVTKQTRNELVVILDRKTKCLAVYQTLLKREKQFFGTLDSLVYDRATILYSLRKLPIPGVAKDKTDQSVFFLEPNELPTNTVNKECVKVHVKPCKDDFQLTMNDLKSGVSNNPDEINRNLQQFLEILAMQEVFFMQGRFVSFGPSQCYFMDPSQFGFQDSDMPELGEGKYVAVGASKGVRMIEGPQGLGGINAAMVLDVKKTAFHVDNQDLIEKVEAILRRDRTQLISGVHQQSLAVLNKALKGLYVRCIYGKERTFTVTSVSKENARTMKLVTKSGDISVEKYFWTKYSMKLKYPTLPLIMERCPPKKNNFYPMEVLRVCENQRVSQAQQTSTQVQSMIRACATLPSLRLQQTTALIKAMKLDSSMRNRWLNGCNVAVTNNLSFTARVLPEPTIEYRTNGWVKPSEKVRRIVCENWYAVALMGLREGKLDESLFRCSFRYSDLNAISQLLPLSFNYIRIFVQHCRQHGMQVSDPLGCDYIRRAKQQDIEPLIMKAKNLGATFIHFVTSDELDYHAQIKYIELQEQVVTQDLKASTAVSVAVERKRQTLDNIVNKTNIKLGGFNYSVHLEKNCDNWLKENGLLIVGLDIAHPPTSFVSKKDRSIVPSVVGADIATAKQLWRRFVALLLVLFFNDVIVYSLLCFHVCDKRLVRGELVDNTMEEIFADILRFFKANRGKPPVHLFVIRDGVSVGQYKYIMNTEVEQIKKACHMVGGPAFRPHITFIVLTKMHSLRFYRKSIASRGKAAEQNIKPGTVVDKCAVDPVLNEFYLNTHSAFQGTAKTPRYTLLFDTSGMEADKMQGIVHALAYDFQIVNMAVSRPSPVMIATCMAKRGRSNYITMYGDEFDNSDNGNGNGVEKDLVVLNTQLSYVSKPLEAVRFSA
uniref:Piwi domain-containing protein n=1 Tax=Setaria digitata TaxID=48799 RepID=A0A915PVY4_9BILA